ncbi:hypothetical protein BDP81DRAFT_487977, partial [Colletotrichum phormii]
SSIEAGVDASSTHFPYPTISIPPPLAEFDFRVAVRFDAQETKTTAEGVEEAELAEGVRGSWSGSLGSGAVIAGGHDLDMTTLKDKSLHEIVTAFKLRTSDGEPAVLEMDTRGLLCGPTDVLDGIAHRSESEARIDPRRYSYRVTVNLSTTDERYVEKVRGVLWVGSGIWDRDELVIEYEVLQRDDIDYVADMLIVSIELAEYNLYESGRIEVDQCVRSFLFIGLF